MSNAQAPIRDNVGNVARNTITQESLIALREDFINVQFQYNVPVNREWINVQWPGSHEPLNYKSFDLDAA